MRQLQLTSTNTVHSSHLQGPYVVREMHINQDVTEWIISVSQSSVPGRNQVGSNACTIIAVFGTVNFLLPSANWFLPSTQSLPQQFIKILMILGNQTYNWLGNQQLSYRRIRGIDFHEFCRDLENSSLVRDAETSNLSDFVNKYNSTLKSLLDTYAPLRTKTITLRPTASWYNDEIRSVKRRRRAL